MTENTQNIPPPVGNGLNDDYALLVGSSMPTLPIIHSFLRDMTKIQEAIQRITDPIELYVAFLYMEKEYVDNNTHNYAETIHQLHSQHHQNDIKQTFHEPNSSVLERLKCPTCSARLKPKQAYDVHIQLKTVPCRQCKEDITLEGLAIANFVKDYKKGRYDRLRKCRARFSYSQSCNTWPKFTKYMNDVLKSEVLRAERHSEERRALSIEWRTALLKMIKQARLNISKFSIDLIPSMYKHLEFVNKICSNLDHWHNDDVLETAIQRYHKFMMLMRHHPKKTLIPTLDIELVWRAHQTHSSTYTRYTYTIHRRVLDYDDTLSSNDMKHLYAKTFIYWSRYYQEPYSPEPPSLSSWLGGYSKLSLLFPPLVLYRIVVWARNRVSMKKDSKSQGSSPFFKDRNANSDRFGMDADDLLDIYDIDEVGSDAGSLYRSDRASSVDSSVPDDLSVVSDSESNLGVSLHRTTSVDSSTSLHSYRAIQHLNAQKDPSIDANYNSSSSYWISTRDPRGPIFKADSLSINQPVGPYKKVPKSTSTQDNKDTLIHRTIQDVNSPPKQVDLRTESLRSSFRHPSPGSSPRGPRGKVSFFDTANVIEISGSYPDYAIEEAKSKPDNFLSLKSGEYSSDNSNSQPSYNDDF